MPKKKQEEKEEKDERTFREKMSDEHAKGKENLKGIGGNLVKGAKLPAEFFKAVKKGYKEGKAAKEAEEQAKNAEKKPPKPK